MWLLFLLSTATAVHACTTLGAGRLATADGSVLVSDSFDGDGSNDPRFLVVPAADHAPGTLRAVYPQSGNYPRYVGDDRGAGNYPPPAAPWGVPPTAPLGHIAQANHTFARYEADNGIANEAQVAMGESSCSARLVAPPRKSANDTDGALFCIDELSRVALERCATARCAVALMGALAEAHGFFGVAGDYTVVPNEGGESLTVGDATPGEVWVFHVLADGGGPGGSRGGGGKAGAIWAAQRVPDDGVAIVANMFVIREVDLDDTAGANFLWSASMVDVAKARGWWKEGTPFDFTAIYSNGEYYNKYYAGRRMWRAFSLLAPSLAAQPGKLPAQYESLMYGAVYPFAVTPDAPVTAARLRALHRDYYNGTAYDLSKGLAAGPWGLPVRWDPEEAYDGAVPGGWERPIGVFRSLLTFIVSLHAGHGMDVWLGPHTSYGTCFCPLPNPRVTTAADLAPFMHGTPHAIDRSQAFWAFRYAVNIAYGRFSDMMGDVRAAQATWEGGAGGGEALVRARRARHVAAGGRATAADARAAAAHATAVVKAWWQLADVLMLKWSDGFLWNWFGGNGGNNPGPVPPGVGANEQNYPKWWLEAVGYSDGSLPYDPGAHIPNHWPNATSAA